MAFFCDLSGIHEGIKWPDWLKTSSKMDIEHFVFSLRASGLKNCIVTMDHVIVVYLIENT